MSETRKGGRKAALDASERVTLTLPPEVVACLDFLAATGRFGGRDKPAVIRYWITKELEELTRIGVLPLSIGQQ
jgi:hypothetical protein